MKVSDVLGFMNLEYSLRGNVDYNASQSLNTFDIEWVSPQPTDAAYHIAGSDLADKLVLDSYEGALQNYMDTKVQEKSYTDGISCATYTASSNPTWKAEADQFILWRDACWAYAIDIYDQVENNQIPAPSVSEFLAGAPVLVW